MLLTHDAISFHQYLDGLMGSNTRTRSGNARQNQSPWMLTDAANIIFQYAKRRCYTLNESKTFSDVPQNGTVIDVDDDDAWAALAEAEGVSWITHDRPPPTATSFRWLPRGIDPVLEELPKWNLVAAALQEIEEEMLRREARLSSRTSWITFPVHSSHL